MSSHILYPRSSSQPSFTISQFLLQPIGKGSYGTVYKAIHSLTLQTFAIKQIHKKGNQSTIHHQLTTLYKLNHQHIVCLYDHFEDQFSVYLVMQFIDGVKFYFIQRQLYESIIAKKKVLNNRQIARLIQQLCLAVEYLHEMGIIHRDIKPQNILFTKKHHKVKLTDFGASFHITDTRKTIIGTPQYTAPQIVKGRSYTKAVDIWSIGVVLFELVTTKLPFDGKTTLKVYENIKSGKYEFPECLEGEEELKDLIRRVLVVKPGERFEIGDILKHSWIKNNLETKSPGQIRLPTIENPEQISNNMMLKQKIFQLELQISKIKSPEKNKEKKLRSQLQMKIAIMQGKVKTVQTLTETKEKRIHALEVQMEFSKKDEREIQVIKAEHEKIRELIEEGNKSYLEQIKQRRNLQQENTKVQQQLTSIKALKSPRSNLPYRKHPSISITTNLTSMKSIDLTQSCNSLLSSRPLSSSQSIEGFFLWLNQRKRTGLTSTYSQ